MASDVPRFSFSISNLILNQWNILQVGDGVSILVLFDGENVKVVSDVCPHMGGPLSQGKINDDGTVSCPWHGYCFSKQSLALEHNPNEQIWIQPMAGENADAFKTPRFRLKEMPFEREGDRIFIRPSSS